MCIAPDPKDELLPSQQNEGIGMHCINVSHVIPTTNSVEKLIIHWMTEHGLHYCLEIPSQTIVYQKHLQKNCISTEYSVSQYHWDNNCLYHIYILCAIMSNAYLF